MRASRASEVLMASGVNCPLDTPPTVNTSFFNHNLEHYWLNYVLRIPDLADKDRQPKSSRFFARMLRNTQTAGGTIVTSSTITVSQSRAATGEFGM